MKIPLNWLAEYVDIKGLSPKKISDGLRFSGTENILELGVSIDKNIVVGEIKEIMKHPNADKLQITKTDVGKNNGGSLQIVCGAPNIRVGQKVPVALVGTKFKDFEIKKVSIRDVESSGMLCSEKELGISDDHSGIMILSSDVRAGTLLSDVLGGSSEIIDAELTPNRGDCLSVTGMAKEVAAAFDRKFLMPKFEISKIESKKAVDVEILEKKLCPRYIAKVIEGVKIGSSPKWMQEKLLACGVRPINNVVDITNYVMLEFGQPLHAFDGTKIRGKIIVRLAKAGEKIVTLDGQKRELKKEDLLISDSKKPIALAGVMGGLNSEVTEKTTTVVFEAAVFDKASIRKTAQRLNLRSEASNRFEKGISLKLPEIAIERATGLLIETSGGATKKSLIVKPKAGKNTDVLSSWVWTQHVGLRVKRVKDFLGIDIPEKEIVKILKNLGFEADKFDFKKEARKHVGKPYVFGASYKTHADMAFDCSYFTDYIYSRIGKFIGYTSLAQFEIGRPVSEEDLRPGDVLFLRGHMDKSAVDHYFVPENHSGYKKVILDKPKEVGHNALYIGDGRIVHARHYQYSKKTKKWEKLPASKAMVIEEDVKVFTENPEYLGARRYVDSRDEYLAVTVPWWRLDVKIEEDLIEEVGRIYGYEKILSTLPSGLLPYPNQNKELSMINLLKRNLRFSGFSELMTYSFVSKKEISLPGDKKNMPVMKISNPLSEEQEYMRVSLWPSLLKAAQQNQVNFEKIKIFEIAKVYQNKEELMLTVLVRLPNKNKSEVYRELKGVIESMLLDLNLGQLTIKRLPESTGFGVGVGAKIILNNLSIGTIWLVNDNVKNSYKLKGEFALAEVSLDKILKTEQKDTKYRPLPKYPISVRDIDLIFDRNIFAEKILSEIAKIDSDILIDFKIIDIFDLKQKTKNDEELFKNKKSVTIRASIGSDVRTLTDEEISGVVESIMGRLKKIGAFVRS